MRNRAFSNQRGSEGEGPITKVEDELFLAPLVPRSTGLLHSAYSSEKAFLPPEEERKGEIGRHQKATEHPAYLA